VVSMPSYVWRDLSWREFRDLCAEKDCVAVIPCGSVEQHGLHLPLGTDLRIAVSLSERAVSEAWRAGYRVLLAEPIPIGVSDMWSGNPGTLWVSIDSFISYVRDYISSIFRNSVKRAVVVNAHGGNSDPLKIALRAATSNFESSYRAYLINYWEFVGDVIDRVFSNPFFHADEAETSIASSLGISIKIGGRDIPYQDIRRPYSDTWHSLSLEKRPRLYFFYREAEYLEIGAFGDPGKYSTDKGDVIVKTFVERFIQLLEEFRKGRL
jgi:creatinine amidohydrolase